MVRAGRAFRLHCALWSTLLAIQCAWAADDPPQGVENLKDSQTSPPGLGLSRWINPETAPFIPVPVIGVDPNSGATVGLMPVFVHTNDNQEISRIIAPDLVHNENFGFGAHGRIFDYPSDNEQWSVVGSIYEHVQREVDAEYQGELSRQQLWSTNASLIYDRDGTPRFYGIGNSSQKGSETNYTKDQDLAQLQVGLNLSHAWQILYTLRPQSLRVESGSLTGVASIQNRFADVNGIGTNTIILNRISAVYDTRDNLVVPRAGVQWVAYGGLASHHGLFNDSTYSETGIDGRSFWALGSTTVLAAHVALRYLPSATDVPFWALSGLGGDRDEVGGDQAMRGFGAGRYYDRNSFASSFEFRHTWFSFDASATHVDIEVTPFIDVGRVFEKTSTVPFTQLHKVAGIGFRGVARPFVVGYVDLGYGGEGLAAFTGINYPF